MKMGLAIAMRRESLGLTQEEVAKYVGVSKASVSRWESGDISNMRRDRIQKLAEILKVSPVELVKDETEGLRDFEPDDIDILAARYENISKIRLKRFPLLGEIACGEPIFADEDRESFVMADMDIHADFCLRAKGESMTGARIYDGDIVFIREMPMVENGEIAAVIIDDEATLKRVYYYPEKGKLVLNPENPDFEPLVYVGDELNEIRILGKAVYFMSAL